MCGDKHIEEMIRGGFEVIDKDFKTYKSQITQFLRAMYPTAKFNNYSDMDLIEKMMEIHLAFNKFNK